MSEKLQIIGFDLGHGKTALARIIWKTGNNSSTPEPEILEINNQRFIITAIAKREGGDDLILGESAFIHNSPEELYFSFKKNISRSSEPEKTTLTKFVREVCKRLEQLDNTPQYFFVGHPSGWSEEEVKDYKNFIQLGITEAIAAQAVNGKLEVKQIIMVKESRAALMHVVSTNKFTINQIQSGILIIDIGSSTTDFTFV